MNPAQTLKDPVCGMTVTPQSPHRTEFEGRPVYFCCAGCKAKFGADPHKYMHPAPADEAKGTRRRIRAGRHRLHLPDASGGAPGPSRRLPEVRHGARAGDAEPRGRGEPRADRLSTSLLVDLAGHDRHHRARHVRPSPGTHGHGDPELGRARALASGRAVGGLAVLRARRAVGRQSQPQHVDADRPRNRRGLRLQRRRHHRAGRVSGLLRLDGPGVGLLRGRRGHHLADAARPVARAEGPRADLGRDPVASRPGAEDGATDQRRRQREGRAARPCPSGRRAAGAPRREGAGRRHRRRRQQRRRRVDADRRADPGDEARRATS